MTSAPPAQCMTCSHWNPGLLNGTEDERQICDAYPNGIPDVIWNNEADHREPQPGDHGIRWTSESGAKFPAYLFPETKRSRDPLCEFTVSRSEDLMFDTLRAAVAESDEDDVTRSEEDDEREQQAIRAYMSTQDINDLPDNAFAYIEEGGTKDAQGKTVPRSKRHFPIHDEAHVRNALARMSSSPFGKQAMAKIHKAAKRMGIGDYDMDHDMDRSQHTPGHAACCPDVLEDESHVFRREWLLDGIDIIRGGQGGDGRTVEAYATVFDVPTEVKDQHGHYMETIHRSAFDEVLRGGISRVSCFYNHGMNMNGSPSDRWSVPIGTPLEIRADGKGLRTVTRYNQGTDGDQIIEAIKNGAIRGYSFRGPIRQSEPRRIPVARSGMALPTVTRMKLGLTEYGPTAAPYYAGAKVLALRSRLSTLDPAEVRELLADLLRATPPQDQEALRTALSAPPASGPGAEDQPIEALRSATEALARKIRSARIRMEPINVSEEA